MGSAVRGSDTIAVVQLDWLCPISGWGLLHGSRCALQDLWRCTASDCSDEPLKNHQEFPQSDCTSLPCLDAAVNAL
jgi:hypothetical protein